MVDPVLTAFLITLIVLFTVGLLIFVVPLSTAANGNSHFLPKRGIRRRRRD